MSDYTTFISNVITGTIDTLKSCSLWGSNLFGYLVALIFILIAADFVFVKRY